MKKTIVTTLVALAALTMRAADDMNFYVVASTTYGFSVSDLQKITFDGGNIVVTDKSGNSTSVALSSVSRMVFSSSTNSISQLDEAGNVSWDDETLMLAAPTATASIYQPSGTLVETATGSVSLARLPRGVYIIRTAGQAFKIVKK